MIFWRFIFIFILVILYSLGLQFEILFAAAAFLAAVFSNYWELIIFGVFFDVLASGRFGLITGFFFLTILLEKALKNFFDSSSLLPRFFVAFGGAIFLTLMFYGWNFLEGAPFDAVGFLKSITIEAFVIGFLTLVFRLPEN